MSMFGMGDAFDYMIMQSDDNATEIMRQCKQALEAGRDPQLLIEEIIDNQAYINLMDNDKVRVINLIRSYI